MATELEILVPPSVSAESLSVLADIHSPSVASCHSIAHKSWTVGRWNVDRSRLVGIGGRPDS
jgi:hypothetical protein